MRFDKRPLIITEQISLLKNRGLVIEDEEKAANYLSNVSYYRLSAYWYTLLEIPHANHVFKNGTTFEMVIDTYVFDRKLRLLVFDEIERIEIALRTQIIYNYAHEFGNNWYEERSLFKSHDYFLKFNTLLRDEMNKSSEVFIRHYRGKYTSPQNPPCWMALELTSFGQLSMLYKNLRSSTSKKKTADHFGLHENVLTSWLETLSYLRNTCAHHSRLWNKKLPKPLIIPDKPRSKWITIIPVVEKRNRLYLGLAAISYLLTHIAPDTIFKKRLKELLIDYKNIPVDYLGFPNQWKEDLFWQ